MPFDRLSPQRQEGPQLACVGRDRAAPPVIDAKVFAFVEAHEFARRDFPQSGYNVHRLSRDVTQLLLHKASLPAREIEEAAEWMVKTIVAAPAKCHIRRTAQWKGKEGAQGGASSLKQ